MIAGADPRRSPGERRGDAVMPFVARPAAGPSGLAIAIAAAIGGVALFGVLEARRTSSTAPATAPRSGEVARESVPPPLYIPPTAEVPAELPFQRPLPRAQEAGQTNRQERLVERRLPPARAVPAPDTTVIPAYPSVEPVRPGPTGIDTGPVTTARPDVAPKAASEAQGADRVRASMIANRSTTVPQGTLIPVVLETAFDSTRPGYARGLVQRDIRGFDGSRVLIPRGSRLIGEYKSDAAPGQNRALISWTRLIRPDGASIAIGSPAADTVGRGGVRAKVNSHFLERFSGAILQSALDVGVALAARSGDSPVLVALPGSLSTTNGAVRGAQIPPTLKVSAGTSVSVFVARDLDFTDVERGAG